MEVNLLARAWVQVNALEPTKSNPRNSLDCREIEIKLDNFIPGELAGIGHRHVRIHRLPSSHPICRNAELAVGKFCVAEPVSKWIERLAREIAIGAICHSVIFEVRQLV